MGDGGVAAQDDGAKAQTVVQNTGVFFPYPLAQGAPHETADDDSGGIDDCSNHKNKQVGLKLIYLAWS